MFRYTVWDNNVNPLIPCLTKYFRHNSCVFGVEDLINLVKLPHIYINKLLPEFDYSAVACMFEKIYNRTFLEAEEFEVDYYENLLQVRKHWDLERL